MKISPIIRPIHPELKNAIKAFTPRDSQLSNKRTVIQNAINAIKVLKEFIQKGEILRANSAKMVLE